MIALRLSRMQQIIESLEEAGWEMDPHVRPEQFESLWLLKHELAAVQLILKPGGLAATLPFLRHH